mmetsp:Transcript_80559/g.184508  ORF Transcript_80559/g.184508 Transcript_80559/m.184508 type:complete len:267 (+) Transcript_80559:939-1739(+)
MACPTRWTRFSQLLLRPSALDSPCAALLCSQICDPSILRAPLASWGSTPRAVAWARWVFSTSPDRATCVVSASGLLVVAFASRARCLFREELDRGSRRFRAMPGTEPLAEGARLASLDDSRSPKLRRLTVCACAAPRAGPRMMLGRHPATCVAYSCLQTQETLDARSSGPSGSSRALSCLWLLAWDGKRFIDRSLSAEFRKSRRRTSSRLRHRTSACQLLDEAVCDLFLRRFYPECTRRRGCSRTCPTTCAPADTGRSPRSASSRL